jgi:hypothetical protein
MPTKEEIDQFIALKRAKKELRYDWGKQVNQVGLRFIELYGRFIEVDNIKTRPKQATFNSLTISLITPFNQLEILPGVNTGYLLDIWKDVKVFSARWDPLKAYIILSGYIWKIIPFSHALRRNVFNIMTFRIIHRCL